MHVVFETDVACRNHPRWTLHGGWNAGVGMPGRLRTSSRMRTHACPSLSGVPLCMEVVRAAPKAFHLDMACHIRCKTRAPVAWQQGRGASRGAHASRWSPGGVSRCFAALMEPGACAANGMWPASALNCYVMPAKAREAKHGSRRRRLRVSIVWIRRNTQTPR